MKRNILTRFGDFYVDKLYMPLIYITILLAMGVPCIALICIEYNRLNQEQEFYVQTKEVVESGMRCTKLYVRLDCKAEYSYLINGKSVDKEIYNSVEEGKTYVCKGSECVETEVKGEQ